MDYSTAASSPSSPISTTFDFDTNDFISSSPSPAFLPSYTTSPDLSFIRTQDTVTSHAFRPFHSQLRPVSSRFEESLEDSQSRGPFGLPPNPSPSLPSDHPSCNILLNASHNTLLQSGNHAHTALYRAYLQVQAENRGLKYAYNTLATSQSSTAINLAAGHTAGSSLQLSLSQRPPQAPLNEKDYPSVKYWHSTSWTNSKTNRDVDVFTGLKPTKKGSFWYLEDANGAPLNEERCNAITKRARQIFAHLNASGAGATKWGDMGNVSQDYYRKEMYSFFPELRLCELDWKVNRLATETYSSWYRKRKDKLAITVKQEDAENHDVAGESSGLGDLIQYKRPRTPGPLQQVPFPKKVKSSGPLQPPARPPTSRPQPTPRWTGISAPSGLSLPVAVPSTPVLPAPSLPSPAHPPTSSLQPWTSISAPCPPVAVSSTPVHSTPSSPSPAHPPTSCLRPTPRWTSVSASSPPVAVPSTPVPPSPSSPSPPPMVTNPSEPSSSESTPSSLLTLSTVHDDQMVQTSSTPAQESREEEVPDSSTAIALEGTDICEKDSDGREGSMTLARAHTLVVDPLDESGNMRAAMPVRFSRITRARASSGISEPTTVGPGTSTKKPPETKKAMKMRTTKSTTARNLYAIFYMKEHPNATTTEFALAFKNLDKSVLLVYEEKSKNMKMAATPTV